jgi:hypothetical protein
MSIETGKAKVQVQDQDIEDYLTTQDSFDAGLENDGLNEKLNNHDYVQKEEFKIIDLSNEDRHDIDNDYYDQINDMWNAHNEEEYAENEAKELETRKNHGYEEDLKNLIAYLKIHHVDEIDPKDILDVNENYHIRPRPHSCRSLKKYSHAITTIHEFKTLAETSKIWAYYIDTDNHVCVLDVWAYAILIDRHH